MPSFIYFYRNQIPALFMLKYFIVHTPQAGHKLFHYKRPCPQRAKTVQHIIISREEIEMDFPCLLFLFVFFFFSNLEVIPRDTTTIGSCAPLHAVIYRMVVSQFFKRPKRFYYLVHGRLPTYARHRHRRLAGWSKCSTSSYSMARQASK